MVALASTRYIQAQGRFLVARDRAGGFGSWGADVEPTEGTWSLGAGPVDAADSESLEDTVGEAAMMDGGAG